MAKPDRGVTRRALHGVAELVLAGPQFRRSGTIHLRVRSGGFGTVAEPDLRVDGAYLVAGDARFPLVDTTIGALAAAVGVDPGAPGMYHDGSDAQPDDAVNVDAEAATEIAACYARGEAALLSLAPAEVPVLWPEHFDIGITLDEVNFGVSPGDGFLDEPYAYVGPWQRRAGAFWNAPFGAARPMRQLPDVDALLSFLAEGRDRVHQDPIAGEDEREPA